MTNTLAYDGAVETNASKRFIVKATGAYMDMLFHIPILAAEWNAVRETAVL
jgi:hypothetical protein